jgi:hypothetical protein
MHQIETIAKSEDDSGLPPVGLNVIVQCDGFRCLAYRNYEGKWIATFDQRELNNVLCVASFLSAGKATFEML